MEKYKSTDTLHIYSSKTRSGSVYLVVVDRNGSSISTEETKFKVYQGFSRNCEMVDVSKISKIAQKAKEEKQKLDNRKF